jgi:hypothetical protein
MLGAALMIIAPLAAHAQTYDLYWNTSYGVFDGTINPTTGTADVSDPLGGGVFRDISSDGSLGGPAGPEVYQLTYKAGDGGDTLFYYQFGNQIVAGAYYYYPPESGHPTILGVGGYTYGKVTPVSTPEINPSVAVAALTLLLGGIAMLRGKRA